MDINSRYQHNIYLHQIYTTYLGNKLQPKYIQLSDCYK